MGTFSANLRVWNPGAPEKTEEIVARVDTVAAFSWIHRERLERVVGAQVLRRIRFSGQKKLVPMIGLALTANQLEAKS
jgi:hypothetical protein